MALKKRTRPSTRRKNTAVLTVAELRQELGIGRAAAYALAKQLGRRISDGGRGRLLVPRVALDAWLRGKPEGGAS